LDRGDYTQWRVFSGHLYINPKIFDYIKVNRENFYMIDIGANIGGFTVLFADELNVAKYEVHLFEPNPGVIPTLQENIKRLRQSDSSIKAIVNAYAVGDKEDTLNLKVDNEHSGLATLGNSDSFSHSVQVRVIPLDQYVVDNNMQHIDFIKIDVESFEPSVFNGARKMMERFKPVIYFEYSHEWFDNFGDAYIEDLLQFFSTLGYQFYRETRDRQLITLPVTIQALKQYNHLNILAV